MIKLKAIQAFKDQDGEFAKDDEFVVNDERAFVLTRTGKAERCVDQSMGASVEAAPEVVMPIVDGSVGIWNTSASTEPAEQ